MKSTSKRLQIKCVTTRESGEVTFGGVKIVVEGAKELRIKMLIRMATNSKVIICSQIQMQLM